MRSWLLRQSFDLGEQLGLFDVLLLEFDQRVLSAPAQEGLVFVALEQLLQVGFPKRLRHFVNPDGRLIPTSDQALTPFRSNGRYFREGTQVASSK